MLEEDRMQKESTKTCVPDVYYFQDEEEDKDEQQGPEGGHGDEEEEEEEDEEDEAGGDGDGAGGLSVDGDGIDGSLEGSSGADDELLSPVGRLEKYAVSANVFNRQMVARSVLETLRAVSGESEEVAAVLGVVGALAHDSEPLVRAELMEQVPHVAVLCQEEGARTSLAHVGPRHLLPLVVKFLTDDNNQVRKTAQAALLVLLEQGLVGEEEVEVLVCPAVLRVTSPSSEDDHRMEAVALLSKLAPLVGQHLTQQMFLRRFASLCADQHVAVRKVCAANVGDLCGVVNAEAVEEVLLPQFLDLCEDDVWEVRKACAEAFTSMSCVVRPARRRNSLAPAFVRLLQDESRWVRIAAFHALGPFIVTFADTKDAPEELKMVKTATYTAELEEELIRPLVPSRGGAEFNAFQYWRDPIPDISLDVPPVEKPPVLAVHRPALPLLLHCQDVVPQPLIDHFVAMTDPSQAQSVDNEIACHCAFSLPAVAMTLGRPHWPLLHRAYRALAADMQWKVRRTLAASIHELALILGEELASRDLVPIFDEFLKDLDEVRVGVLRHLADFIRLLRPEQRREYLPRFGHFLKTDNERNWRFRMELAEQLLALVELYTPAEVQKHLVPLALALLADRVAAVRQAALRLVTRAVAVSPPPPQGGGRALLADLAERLAHSGRWARRQLFTSLCSLLVAEKALPLPQFSQDVLPHLLDLTWDRVPNVRLAVARVLAQELLPLEYFSAEQNPHHELLTQAVNELQGDTDRDVRYFASWNPTGMGAEEAEEAGEREEEEEQEKLEEFTAATTTRLEGVTGGEEPETEEPS